MKTDPTTTAFAEIAQTLRAAGVFGAVESGARIDCAAKAAAAPAWYRLDLDQGKLWMTLATPDRWLSHSVEADLTHTGDKLDELLEEEFVELDLPWGKLAFEHFRDERKEFIFRCAIPLSPKDLADAAHRRTAATAMLAFEACFRRLGDLDQDKGE